MSAFDFRETRTIVVGELIHELAVLSEAVRTAKAETQWYMVQLDAAYRYMVENELFPDEAAAEDAIVLLAEGIVRQRKADHDAALLADDVKRKAGMETK